MNRRNFFLNTLKLGTVGALLFNTDKSFGGVLGYFAFWRKHPVNANNIVITINSDTQNFNLRTVAMLPPYSWDGSSVASFSITINSGIYVWSDSTSLAALDASSLSIGSSLNIVNNGFIIGKGGNGNSYVSPTFYPATTGGLALILGATAIIDNTAGYICGGGGGGGGMPDAAGSNLSTGYGYGGGGAGGGLAGSPITNGQTNSGGAIGLAGSDGSASSYGGGGGRIVPGVGGIGGVSAYPATSRPASNNGKGGGSGGGGSTNLRVKTISKLIHYYYLDSGGGGGGWGAVGGNALTSDFSSDSAAASITDSRGGIGGSDSGLGQIGSCSTGTILMGTNTCAIGAAGGKGVDLNGNSITWVSGASSTARVFGAVS